MTMSPCTSSRPPTSSPALLFILVLAGLSKHETRQARQPLGIIGMAIALVATIWLVLRESARNARSATGSP